MTLDLEINYWVVISFILGFFLSFLVVFIIGYRLGRHAKNQDNPYQLLQPTTTASSKSSETESVPLSSAKVKTQSSQNKLAHQVTFDRVSIESKRPSQTLTKTEPTQTTKTPTGTTQLLHKQLAQLEVDEAAITITPEFQQALDLMNHSQECIFVTGEAGTGKSTLLKYFVAHTSKKIVVLSPTGTAAINVGGQTIHSFFKFKPNVSLSDVKKEHGEIYQALDAIIIDEISMVRADLIDAIDKSLKLSRDCLGKPFGGTQIIMFGDLFQLPPVVVKSEEGQFFSQYYRSPYFFDGKIFVDLEIRLIKLKTIFRQNDPSFVKILNNVRINRVSDELLNELNRHVDPSFEPQQDSGFITLTTTNRRADEKNFRELEKISGEPTIYEGQVEGKFDKVYYPTDLQLRLKVGAQVMMLTNDAGKRWVNGTVGIVEDLSDDQIKVQIPKPIGQPPQICTLERHTWKVPQYRINHDTGMLESATVGTFTQFPLRLAWAITIHKSQGKTLECAVVDLTGGAFAHGQTYVALSRCTSLSGLVLTKQIQRRDIIVDRRIFGFMDHLQSTAN